jgi:hypothetical protein
MRALVLTAVLAASLAVPAGAAAKGGVFKDMAGTVQVRSEKSGASSAEGSALPTWSSSFAYGGTIYPYTMVGSSPFAAPRTTTVRTVVVPLDVTLEAADPGAEVRRGSSIASLALASPVFQNARFDGPSYATQYGNAMQKDMFWTTGGSNAAYNVLLRNDTVFPARTLSVPAKRGTGIMGATTGVPFARVDYKWFSAQVKKIVDDLKLPAGTLAIVLSENVYLYDGDTCCVFGIHAAVGNGGTKTSTYVYATWANPALFSPRPGQSQVYMSDVHVLSHEIEGWLTDPFLDNTVPGWTSAFAPQYGCSDQLDSTDPLIDYGFEVRMPNGVTYHPQEPSYFSWFAREAPSRGLAGRYSYGGTLTRPATSC